MIVVKVPPSANRKSFFTLNPPPSLPRLASLLCPDQLPQEALQTPVPGQPNLRIVSLPGQMAVELTWSMPLEDPAALTHVHRYYLYACPVTTCPALQQVGWKSIGVFGSGTLPMTCRLSNIRPDCKFYFAVCAQDVFRRFGTFCKPLCLM